jgi:amidase
LCCDIQTTNSIFGTTSNPWDKERTAGGSSGGEAAAIALGLSVLGVGSDTAGSIRIPSSYCGVYGFKPSIGKIARRGLKPLHGSNHSRPDSITVVGPIARSVRDLMLCYELLSGESDSGAGKQVSVKPPKILWTEQFSTQVIADEVSTVVRSAFDRLKRADVNVRKVESPLDLASINKAFRSLSMYEFTPKEYSRAVYHLFWSFEVIRSWLRGGLDARYEAIKKLQLEASATLEAFLDEGDCWVLPATPTAAFLHQKTWWPIPLRINGKVQKRDYFEATSGLTAPISFLGNPSVIVPVGKDDSGMPIAVQIVGKRGDDVKLLNVASYVAGKIGQQWACPDTVS